MASLDAFLPYVRAAFPGVPNEILRKVVRDAAIEFCQRTRLIQRDVTVRVVAGRSLQAMTSPDGAIYEILGLDRDGSTLYPETVSDLRANPQISGTATRYAMTGEGWLYLWPEPEAVDTLTARVVIAPLDDAAEVPDVLFADWREAIAGGAKRRLGRDYTPYRNEEQALIGTSDFEWGVTKAQLQRAKGRATKPIRSRTEFF